MTLRSSSSGSAPPVWLQRFFVVLCICGGNGMRDRVFTQLAIWLGRFCCDHDFYMNWSGDQIVIQKSKKETSLR